MTDGCATDDGCGGWDGYTLPPTAERPPSEHRKEGKGGGVST